jgi:hypothetical protein
MNNLNSNNNPIPSRNQRQFEELIRLGYTGLQADKLINRPHARLAIESVILRTPQLTAFPYCLSLKDILNIVSLQKNEDNLLAIQEHYYFLRMMGFKHQYIVNLASHREGNINLYTVRHNFVNLNAMGFSPEEISQMTSFPSGYKNIEALLHYYDEIKRLKISHVSLVVFLSNPSGYLVIKHIIENPGELTADVKSDDESDDMIPSAASSNDDEEAMLIDFLNGLGQTEPQNEITEEEFNEFLIHQFISPESFFAAQGQTSREEEDSHNSPQP